MRVKTRDGKYTYLRTVQSTCNGECLFYKSTHRKYQEGTKSCLNCNTFMKYEGVYCPCCGIKLRSRSRSYKNKDVKRI